MSEDVPGRAEVARTASGEQIKTLLHDRDEETLVALLENPNLDEGHFSTLLSRLDLPAKVLSGIAAKAEWRASEAVRVGLVRHPKTQRRTALTLLRQLFLFDLVKVALAPSTPAEVKRVAEEVMVQRVPQIPIGEKLTLARRGPARVAGAILAEGHPQAMKLALGNSFLTESQVLKVIASAAVPERVIAAIAQHPKWSVQYNVRVALIRNWQTPVPVVLAFLPNLTMRDLKDVAALETVPAHVRRYIEKELARRAGKNPL
ncbi:MAG: hypothetical protein WA823_15075 [Candidatus Acidiferrales bacterium]